MAIRIRSARPKHVQRSLDVLDIAPDSYGPSSTQGLAPLVERLLGEGALRGPALETSDPEGELDGVAFTGFAPLAIAQEWILNPPKQFPDYLLERERDGNGVLLRPDAVASLNARGELALVLVAFGVRAADEATHHNRIMAMMSTFKTFHEGYHCPLLLHPNPESAEGPETLRRLGLRFHGALWSFSLDDLKVTPYSMFASLGARPAPRLGFSPAEKEHLFEALLGASDAELADSMGISQETVRKRWRSVFDRVAQREDLHLFPRVDANEAKRGPEKRGTLLEYLASHLEELRPHRAD
jgi:DNA-binding CsgD family transcriptional regulator